MASSLQECHFLAAHLTLEDESDEDGGDRPIVSDKGKCKGPDEAVTDPAERKKPNKRQKIVVLN